MITYYLVDYENVHGDGVTNIITLTKQDHVYLFTANKNEKISFEIACASAQLGALEPIMVEKGKQSVDKYILTYLGYLLGEHGDKCQCVIVSKDKEFDNVLKFWKTKGFANIKRVDEIPKPGKSKGNKSPKSNATVRQNEKSAKNAGGQSEAKKPTKSAGGQSEAKKPAKCAGGQSEEKKPAKNTGGQSEAKKQAAVMDKREAQIRSFYGQHFKKQAYKEHKEAIIQIIRTSTSKQQLNNELTTLLKDGVMVSHIYKTIQPLVKDLPGRDAES